MDRRRFNTVCTGLLAGAAAAHASQARSKIPYPRTRLLYQDDSPVLLNSLKPGQAYIFSYPYRTTPCFLIRLNASAPGNGSWPGGLGDDQSVVAFSAICSHKMTHPARPISHIAYRSEPVTFYDANGKQQTERDVISCCSERSVYNATHAAAVISGPAPAPLASINLTTDNNGMVIAIGSSGEDRYERFLTQFGFRLAMEYGVTDVRAKSGDTAVVTRAEDFSAQQVLC